MATLGSLKAACIIERDQSGNVLWVWSYPSVNKNERRLIWRNCCITEENSVKSIIPFIFFRNKNDWYYITTCNPQEETVLNNIQQFSLCLVTSDFNPEKYAVLSRIFCNKYETTANPASLLEQYLSVLTKGSCESNTNGVFSINDFKPQQAYSTASLKDIIQSLGIESIYLYTALLLKKKVLIVHNRIELLLEFTRALPALVWHRQDWSILYPWVTPGDPEWDLFTKRTHCVVGCLAEYAGSFNGKFDVVVNVPMKKVDVDSSCKETFAMGKIHKDIAKLMMDNAQDESVSNIQLIKVLTNKTKEILQKLNSLSDENGNLTLEGLQEKGLNKTNENFLFHLALAERSLQL